MIGWKQASYNYIPVLVKLEIPDDAKVIEFSNGWCRCDKAKVLYIETFNGDWRGRVAWSLKDPSFKYVPGRMVYSNAELSIDDKPFCKRKKKFAPGIFFFKTREEAVNYEY